MTAIRAARDGTSPAVMEEAARLLERGMARLGVVVDADAAAAMLQHLELLVRWNRAYNLTAVDDPLRAVIVHVLDSLSILPYLKGPRVIDVGTGAGFPGLPLAFARPDLEFVLLDSRGKKIRFVQTVIRAAGADNASAVQARVERYPHPGKFDTLAARAFSSLSELIASGRHLLAPGARILAMKGEFPADEVRALGEFGDVRCEVVRLDVPFLDAARHLAIIEISRIR